MNNNILFFINGLKNSGGTERVTSVIANNLAMRNKNIFIATLEANVDVFFKLNDNVKIIDLSTSKSKLDVILNLRVILKRYNIDILVAVDTLLGIYAMPACFVTKTKCIVWEHFNFDINLGRLSRQVARYISSIFAWKVIVLSEQDKKTWIDKIPSVKKKIQVIYNPSSFEISTSQYPISNRTVLCVGRLSKQKGFDIMLEIWKDVIKKDDDWNLIIVGSGSEQANLIHYIKDNRLEQRVTLLPAVTDIDRIYREAAIFCLPSRFEGFVLSLLEAQSFGLPTVAFDCKCGPKEVLDNGNGYVIPYLDVNAFSNKLQMLMLNTELRIKMSAQAKIRAKKFSIDESVSVWLSVLDMN